MTRRTLGAFAVAWLVACSGDSSSGGDGDATLADAHDATGDIDCSAVGCAAPPPCGQPCTATCGCCTDPSCIDSGVDAGPDVRPGPDCSSWDSDWGETPKPDAPGATPCRDDCDCVPLGTSPKPFHCCALPDGGVCSPEC